MTADGRAGWLARRRAGQDAVGAIPDAALWVAAIARWWTAGGADGEAGVPPSSAIPSELASAPGGADLAAALDAFAARSNLVAPAAVVAAVLVGGGLASAITQLPPSLADFDAATSFAADGRDDLGAFEAAFVAACKGTPELKAVWTTLLEEIAADLSAYGIRDVAEDSQHLLQGIPEQQAALRPGGDYRQVWRNRLWTRWYVPHVLSRFRVLLEFGATHFMRALDRVPTQPLRQAILDLVGLGRDVVGVLELLVAAPTTLDESGSWNGSVASLMTFDTMTSLLQRDVQPRLLLAATVAPAPASDEKAAVRSSYRDFFRISTERADGRFLGLAFALEAVRRATHPRPRPGVGWTFEEIALEEAIEALARLEVSIDNIQADWLRYTGNAAPANGAKRTESAVPHLLMAACLWATRCFASEPIPRKLPGAVPRDGAAAVWGWYRQALLDADVDLNGQMNPYGPAARWIFTTLALALVCTENPVAESQTLWRDLYEQRFRGRMVADFEAAQPSLHLLRVAQTALEWLVGGAALDVSSAERAEAMWVSLHDICIQLPSSIYVSRVQQARDPLTALYSYLPHTFHQGWAKQVVQDAAVLASDDVMCIFAAANLVRNGIAPDAVRSCMKDAGCDPLQAGDVLRKFSERVEQRDRNVAETLNLLDAFVSTKS